MAIAEPSTGMRTEAVDSTWWVIDTCPFRVHRRDRNGPQQSRASPRPRGRRPQWAYRASRSVFR